MSHSKSHSHRSDLDPLALRHAFASFATGVTVITARDGLGNAVGITANSFGSVSLEPPLVQWCLRINSGLHRSFVEAPTFAVSVLAADQEAVARQFASRSPDRFAGVDMIERPGEPPLVRGALAHFLCKKVNDFRVGDHELFIGEVTRASAHDGSPLLFYSSKFSVLKAS